MKMLSRLAILAIVMLHPYYSCAQSLRSPQPTYVNRAISGVLQSGMESRGFAANDPRFANTLARITPQLTAVAGTAATITVGAVTAPGWASVALTIGVGAVVTYAVNLGLNALTKWLFRNDGKIDESGEPLPVDTSTSMALGGAYWKVSFHSGNVNIDIAGGDGEAIARQGYYEYLAQTNQNTQATPNCSVSANQVVCGMIYAYKQASGAPASCVAGTMFKAGACTGYTFALPPSLPTKTGVTPQVAINDIPASDQNKQLNPAIIAALANRAWQNAASQPSYDGLPYPQSNPLSAPEAQSWMNQNPTYAPQVQDFAAPNPTISGQPSPWALPQDPTATTTSPAITPNQNTINPASANPLENLGPDPGTPAPTLEKTPTAQEILQPLLNLFPDLKNYSPSMSVGSCPRPTLNLFGQTQTMEAHCTLLENHRGTIHAAMVLAFTLLALLIILSA